MKKTQLFLTAAALTVVGGLGLTTSTVWASSNFGTEGPHTALVEALAQKFSLNQDEVQAVFDEQRQTMMNQRHEAEVARLNQLVSDGKLTAEQRDLIQAKMSELQQQRVTELDSMRDLTPEERHQAAESRREELEAWAADHGIDTQYLHPQQGMGRGPRGTGPMGQ